MKNQKNWLVILVVLLYLVLLSTIGLAQTQQVLDRLWTLYFEPQVTEREFVETLPWLLGLEDLLPTSATFDDYVSLLEKKDIIPLDFVVFPDDPITKGRAAMLIMHVLGLKPTSTEKPFWERERLALIVIRRYQIIPIEDPVDPSQLLLGAEFCAMALRITDKTRNRPLPEADIESILGLREKIEEFIMPRYELSEILQTKIAPTY